MPRLSLSLKSVLCIFKDFLLFDIMNKTQDKKPRPAICNASNNLNKRCQKYSKSAETWM